VATRNSEPEQQLWARTGLRAALLSLFRSGAILVAIACISPGVIAVHYILGESWRTGLLIGIPWLIAYVVLSLWLHRRRYIHIGVSFGCALASLIVFGAGFTQGVI
jgi:predicted cation transporter